VTEGIQPLAQKILSLLQIGPHASSEKLRERALAVVYQAETGWFDLLRDLDQKDRMERSIAGPVIAPLQRLLASLEDHWRGISFLQIYFCRQGRYAEADSRKLPYSRNRWTTLKIPLPSGTGDRYLRLDPADKPGFILIREIAVQDERGNLIWRANGGNAFQGCRIVGEETRTMRDACLVLLARTDDPQMLIDCPVTDRPVEMRVVLYAADGDTFPLPAPGAEKQGMPGSI
jgi:hypothetical protein